MLRKVFVIAAAGALDSLNARGYVENVFYMWLKKTGKSASDTHIESPQLRTHSKHHNTIKLNALITHFAN